MDQQYERLVLVGEVVDEDELALMPAGPAATAAMAATVGARAILAQMLAASQQLSHEDRVVEWIEARDKWLAAKLEKSESENTLRSYRLALDMFMAFVGASQLLLLDDRRRAAYRRWRAGMHDLTDAGRWTYLDALPAGSGVEPWQVEADHVRQWQTFLRQAGCSSATVSARLAALSSFFSFVINGKRRDEFGIERCIYADPTGKAYENPVRAQSIKRPRIVGTRPKQWLSDKQVWAMLGACNRKSLSGARNYALLRTFVLTGYRSAEVLSLRWGDIRKNPQHPGEYVVMWKGKGGKEQEEAFPASVVKAIEAYLALADRWPADPEAYIWQPLTRHGWENLAGARDGQAAAGPITDTQATNVLRRALRGVVDEPMLYSIHSLRRTHANAHYEETGDLGATQKRLHHSDPKTTLRYIRESEVPRDNFSRQLELRFGI